MNRKVLIALLLVAIVGLGVGAVSLVNKPKEQSSETSQVQDEMDLEGELAQFAFENPKKSAHFEGSTPAHGAVFAGAPINVVIDFNFDLASNSTISIKKDGIEYGIGNTKVDSNKLALRRDMGANTPDGLYRVEYTACWPDKTCHDGFFQFAIDRNLGKDFSNMTEKSSVAINMSDLMFDPSTIVINKGTKVTWTNDDSDTHYVNTDSHPHHTYLLDMNSKAMENGDTYSYTFTDEGFYPYHCSAHEASMRGAILVQ